MEAGKPDRPDNSPGPREQVSVGKAAPAGSGLGAGVREGWQGGNGDVEMMGVEEAWVVQELWVGSCGQARRREGSR